MKALSRVIMMLTVIWWLPGEVSAQITKTTTPQGWIIKTKSSTYQIIVDASGNVKPVYYGAVEQAAYSLRNTKWFEGIYEVPVRGALPFKTAMLEVVFNDQVRDADLEYVNGEITTIDGRAALKIIQKDRFYPLEVTSYIRVLPEYDILEKWAVIKNTGNTGSIQVENFQSGSIVLPADDYVLTHMSGKEMNEFQLQETLLTPGVKTIQSVAYKSNFNPPWFMVRPKDADKETGPAWFGSLHYSGNWKLTFDKWFDGYVQILGGINYWDTAWDLKPGTTLETPKFAVGFTKNGAEGVSQSLAAYVRKDILPAAHRNDLRPVLYNSWEATFYDVNEKQQVELAKIAKEIGIELFVMDDGWQYGRTSSQGGLGDWVPDKNKFPNGLSPLIKEVHNMGMKFGLWVEPEAASTNSDLYRAHPEWVLHSSNRTKSTNRQVLNLAKEEVYQYVYQSLSKILKENDIDFIKWDQNNYFSDTGWPEASAEMQREVRIRYVNNVYRLVDELKKQFPDVSFESCASGGGRVDLGMLSRMDQAWVSDNTSPLDRTFMQYSYLGALPANTMVSWVTHNTFHQPISLEYKFDVSMSGVLGVGYNISKWNEEERAIAKKKIAEYKVIQPMVQQGILYRLVSPYEGNKSALQYNTDDKNTSAVLCYNLAEYLPGSQLSLRSSNVLKLKGLKNDQMYQVQKLDERDKPGLMYRGDFLMNIGIAWPVKGANTSQILLVSATK